LKLSVVMPSTTRKPPSKRSFAACRRTPYEKELILVNDCSKDRTREIMGELEKRYPNVRCFHHEQNQGKGARSRPASRRSAATSC